jgi:hypothetical protein
VLPEAKNDAWMQKFQGTSHFERWPTRRLERAIDITRDQQLAPVPAQFERCSSVNIGSVNAHFQIRFRSGAEVC